MSLSHEQIVEQIEEVIEQIQPYFLMHGGACALDRFESGTVYVRLSGACGGCAASDYTLTTLVEVELKKEVPQVERVVAVE